jgi:hypothetical protein
MDNYIVISSSEDGVHVDQYTKEGLESALTNKDWGEVEILRGRPSGDPANWNAGVGGSRTLLIIKGSCVVPQVVETATKYELP